MVNSLCKEFSPPLLVLPPPLSDGSLSQDGPEAYHPFPPPSALAAPEVAAKLRVLGFGYRAEFIQRTAKMLIDTHGDLDTLDNTLGPAETWLQDLRLRATNDARIELLKFVGVGRKVADCVLLMSLDKVRHRDLRNVIGILTLSRVEGGCSSRYPRPPNSRETLQDGWLTKIQDEYDTEAIRRT